MQSFTVGPRFKGVKMLPPGPHLVSYNSSSGNGSDFAPTIAFYAHLAPRQVLVRRWDAAEEMLLPLQDPDEVPASLRVHGRCNSAPLAWAFLCAQRLACGGLSALMHLRADALMHPRPAGGAGGGGGAALRVRRLPGPLRPALVRTVAPALQLHHTRSCFLCDGASS